MRLLAGLVVVGMLAGGCSSPEKPTASSPTSAGASDKRPTGQTLSRPPVQREPG